MNLKSENLTYFRMSPAPHRPESYNSYWVENPGPWTVEVLLRRGWNQSSEFNYGTYFTNVKDVMVATLNELGHAPLSLDNLGYYVEAK